MFVSDPYVKMDDVKSDAKLLFQIPTWRRVWCQIYISDPYVKMALMSNRMQNLCFRSSVKMALMPSFCFRSLREDGSEAKFLYRSLREDGSNAKLLIQNHTWRWLWCQIFISDTYLKMALMP
jgi:hypothetical protein